MAIIWLMHLIQLYDSVIYDVIMQVGGGLVGSFIVLWLVERKRKAKLKIEPLELSGALEPKELRQYLDQESGSIYVGFQVSNPKMGDFLALFFDREPAMSCRVYFQFDTPFEKGSDTGDGVKSYRDYPDNEGIYGRWNEAVAPQYKDEYDDDNKKGDCNGKKDKCENNKNESHHYRFQYIQYEIDIPQGITRTVYIAVCPPKKDELGKDKYYLWNDRMNAYLGSQPYMDNHHKDLRLKNLVYRGKITIVTLGRTYEKGFVLYIPDNPTGHEDSSSAIHGFQLKLV